MNRPSLQPSPLARNARKPLVNLTAHFQNSSDQLKKSFEKAKPIVPRSESTQSIRPRQSIGQTNKVRELRQRKNSLMIKQQQKKIEPILHKSQTIACKNHYLRHASHEIVDKPGQYYCFQCALRLTKQKIKICKIKQKLPNNQQKNTKRQSQLSKYLQKCCQITKQLIEWQSEQQKKAEEILLQYNQKIQEQINHMQVQLNRIKQIYANHILSLEKRKEVRLEQIKLGQPQMKKLIAKLNNTKFDIQSSIQGIKVRLSQSEFQLVMAEYWKIIDKAEVFIKKQVQTQYKTQQFCVDKELTNSNMIDTCQGYNYQNLNKNSDEKLRKSKEQGKDFTFSKKRFLETPSISKTLQGIKFADSEGQSDPRNSSMRSSIVNSKFTFE